MSSGCRIQQELSHGELVKKAAASILFLLLGLVLCFPAVAHAGTNSAQRKAQKDAKKSWQTYMKQQKKSKKSQEKAMKKWNKQHQTGHR